MLFRSVVLALSFASSLTIALPGPIPPAGCATEKPTDLVLDIARSSIKSLENAELLAEANMEWIDIPTYFFIFPKHTSEEGMVYANRIDQQVDYLNKVYQAANIRFTKMNALMLRDDKLYNNADLLEIGKHRQGGNDYRALNIYVCNLDKGIGGLAHYPVANPDARALTRDGVRVTEGVFAGSKNPAYNQGGTVAHEVGHWLSLIHTFEGGCDDRDGISDTPAQAAATFGCPKVATSSCPGKPGVDSIFNYMNYADDACKSEWTPGQIQQMRNAWFKFRARR